MAVAGLVFCFANSPLACFANLPLAAQDAIPAQNAGDAAQTTTLPASTKINLAVTSPVWTHKAAAGDSIYAQTIFPVALNGKMAIPPGTYMEGRLDAVSRPSRFSGRAELRIHATKLIFANGYTVVFVDPATASATENALAPVAVADLQLTVSAESDVMMDNGTQFEITLQTQLPLDAKSVALAVRASKPLSAARVPSATLCRPTPGTPGTSGTPDTVIPGTSGTPDTVIPGVNGMPDTVIPGTPATPATVIPGTPGTAGTPGTTCPGPPIVMSSAGAQWDHTGKFKVNSAVLIAGQSLPKGSYTVSWTGMGPQVEASIVRSGAEVMKVPARVVLGANQNRRDVVTTHINPDGTASIQMLQFSKEQDGLAFDAGAAKQNP